MKVREYFCELELPAPPEEVFPFFADAANLEAITPPWLNFHIVTPRPIVMHEGALIDYRVRVRGLPLRWRTRINLWQPPNQFVDEQLRGPYRMWIHEHTFTPHAGSTLARDHVRYAIPFDFLLHRFVRSDIEKIFRFRAEALKARFGRKEPDVQEVR
jgi:ligand-binding SRPBCC domain-containing protein